MFFLKDYEDYVVGYLENCGEDPCEYDVEEAAWRLRDALDGGSPDAMDPWDFDELVIGVRGEYHYAVIYQELDPEDEGLRFWVLDKSFEDQSDSLDDVRKAMESEGWEVAPDPGESRVFDDDEMVWRLYHVSDLDGHSPELVMRRKW